MSNHRAAIALLTFGSVATAHRLDEYLQAATIAVDQDRITIGMRLSPGVAITPIVLASADRNADGVISDKEELDYAERVLHDVSLTLNGETLPLRLASREFAATRAMREGVGEIHFGFIAEIVHPRAGPQVLQFENNHLPQIGAYLVNALAPSDAQTTIVAQHRNFTQSSYRMDYTRAATSVTAFSGMSWSNPRAWLMALALLLTMRIVFLWWRVTARQYSGARRRK